MTPCMPRRSDDRGVSLVLALVFILLVGLFATVALSKSQTVLTSGQALRDRGLVQYTLDGAVDKALQTVRADVAASDPSTCAQPSAPTATGFITLNDTAVTGPTNADWTCTLLAGRARKSTDSATTDYAVIVTSGAAGALTTQSGASADVTIGGSIYANGPEVNGDLNKVVAVQDGDYVTPSSDTCLAEVAALSKIVVTTGGLKTCTDQDLTEALPLVSLPTAPAYTVSTLLGSGVDVVTPGSGSGRDKKPPTTCRVFYPGRYLVAPDLLDGSNYFVSGVYSFEGIGTWSINDADIQVTGGEREVATDSPALTGNCETMTDAKALAQPEAALFGSLATYEHGVTWVFGGASSLSVPKGTMTLFTPTVGASAYPVNLAAFGVTTSGYPALVGGSPPTLLSGTSNATNLVINAKLYAPTARVDLFSTNGTEAVVQGGLVAFQLQLQSSAASTALSISTPGTAGRPAPPFRTVRISANAASSGTSAINTAVATIANFTRPDGTYAVSVKSWRTD